MSEYYAVIRSSNELAHYGIRGMRWGVRKAIQRGDMQAYSKQYRKAEKKLKKLSEKADIEKQKEVAKKHNRRAAIATGIGLAGLGTLTGNKLVAKRMAKDAIAILPTNKKSARKERIVGEGKGIHKEGEGLGIGPVGDRGYDRVPVEGGKSSSRPNGFRTIEKMAKVVTVAGLGTAAYQKSRALSAKLRTTKKGHAKAVAKRDEFRREMNKTFAGVKSKKNKRRKQYG